jgi:pyrroline-5-carboxylate reductase
MASSMIGGLIDSGHPADHIRAADPWPESLDKLRRQAPIRVCQDNAEAARDAEVVILAVKPQVMAEAGASIAAAIRTKGSLVISIAAGITIDSLRARLGADAAIVRCMPNTPALLRCGASGLYASDQVSDRQRRFAEQILSAIGSIRWVQHEQQLDAVTALSGSGPAYFFLFLEAMIDAGVAQGLDRETATELATQTALGAARMARESDVDLAELRHRVTSPGGTTERAVQSFEQDGLRDVVARAMQAAAGRAAEMAREMG